MMKFSANVSQLSKALNPVAFGANRAEQKDFDDAYKVTLEPAKTALNANSYGGKIAVASAISSLNEGMSELDYEHKEGGTVTINAKDLMVSLSSFRPDTTVIIETKGNELVITNANDVEELQALPTLVGEDVKVPDEAETFDAQVKINRNVFIEGLKKVFFAIGFEDLRQKYLYWMMRASGDHVRFAAGTGARFATLDVKGKGILKGKTKVDILFPKEHSGVLQDILSNIESDWVEVRRSSKNSQIVITCGAYKVVLVSFDGEIEWVDEEKFLKIPKSCRLETNASDWDYATRGIMATFNDDVKKAHDTHETALTLDLGKSELRFSANPKMRSLRHIPIMNIEESQAEHEGMEFKVTSRFLREAAMLAPEKNGKVYVELVDQSKPVFIRYPTKIADNQEQELRVFFATVKDKV